MILSLKIIELLKGRSGSELSYAADIERLSLDIESATGEHIGVNTLKRLLGHINDERNPRPATLDIIARYLGYANWEVLEKLNAGSNSDFNTSETVLDVKQLQEGQIILISYQPDRKVRIRYEGEKIFMVEESENSKLKVGDILHITHLANDFPLYISNVIRDGQSLNSFTAGKVQGIRYVLVES